MEIILLNMMGIDTIIIDEFHKYNGDNFTKYDGDRYNYNRRIPQI